jgi:hypothetical protein
MEVKHEVEISSEGSSILCARVIAYRALGFEKDKAVLAMQELKRRADNGDSFDYNEFIKLELNKLPKFDPNRLEKIKIKNEQIKT